jgi:hypothetical protein
MRRRRASEIPAASTGTHPVTAIDPGAIAAAGRHQPPLRQPSSSYRPLVMSAVYRPLVMSASVR